MAGLDSLIVIIQFFMIIAAITVFIMGVIFSIKNVQQKSNELFKKGWFLIPLIFGVICFISTTFLKKHLNKEVTKELIEKIDKSGKVIIPNTNIILDKNKIRAVEFSDRFISDSIYNLKLHDYYYIRLERTLADSNKYWVFVEKYMSTRGSDPAAIFDSK